MFAFRDTQVKVIEQTDAMLSVELETGEGFEIPLEEV